MSESPRARTIREARVCIQTWCPDASEADKDLAVKEIANIVLRVNVRTRQNVDARHALVALNRPGRWTA